MIDAAVKAKIMLMLAALGPRGPNTQQTSPRMGYCPVRSVSGPPFHRGEGVVLCANVDLRYTSLPGRVSYFHERNGTDDNPSRSRDKVLALTFPSTFDHRLVGLSKKYTNHSLITLPRAAVVFAQKG